MERDYSKHSAKQLIALYVSEDVDDSKKVKIEERLFEKGLVEEKDLKYWLEEKGKEKKKSEDKAPEGKGLAAPGKIGDVVELPGGPVSPEAFGGKSDEIKFAFEVGNEVKITLPKKKQTETIKDICGDVIERQSKGGVNKYRVKTELGTFVKSEKQLLKDNKK